MMGRRRSGGLLDWKLVAGFSASVLMLVVAAVYAVFGSLWFPVLWIPALLAAGCFGVAVWWLTDIFRDRR